MGKKPIQSAVTNDDRQMCNSKHEFLNGNAGLTATFLVLMYISHLLRTTTDTAQTSYRI